MKGSSRKLAGVKLDENETIGMQPQDLMQEGMTGIGVGRQVVDDGLGEGAPTPMRGRNSGASSTSGRKNVVGETRRVTSEEVDKASYRNERIYREEPRGEPELTVPRLKEGGIREVGILIYQGNVAKAGGALLGIEEISDEYARQTFQAMGLYQHRRSPDFAYNGSGMDFAIFAWGGDGLPEGTFLVLYEEPGETWRKAHPNRFVPYLFRERERYFEREERLEREEMVEKSETRQINPENEWKGG